MARYDVYRAPEGAGWWLDVQAEVLDMLSTRVVVPLLPGGQAPAPAKRLNPVFEVEGSRAVMVTQYLAAVPLRMLGRPVGSLADRADEIGAAVGMVFLGF
ncbi:CcdB family protein [Albidovulum sp.]|jgi:toxin CcdB|uniref:CcdB family protein n=1 Tax=Albidovulum sp. TaxID=1872424 RepID=UPI00304AE072